MESEFQCAQCGAIYDVTIEKVASPVRDTPVCAFCGKVMRDSVGNLVRTYTLKLRPGRTASDPHSG